MDALGWTFIITVVWPFVLIGFVVLLAVGRSLFGKWKTRLTNYVKG